MFINRLDALKREIEALGLDGILLVKREYITNLNCYYISGFSGSTADLIITGTHHILLTDDRYVEQAMAEAPHFEIIKNERPFLSKVVEIVQKLGIKKLGYEDDGLTVKDFHEIKSEMAKAQIELVSTSGLIKKLRTIKDALEISLLREAGIITVQALSYIINTIKPGVSERELALELEYQLQKKGALKPAFETILVSGPRTSLQHGRPTERLIKEGDFVLLDFGACYKFYCVDMTRTICIGYASDKQQEIYKVVRDTIDMVIEKIRAGINAKELVQEASVHFEKAGYGPLRGLGHGVGLEVHEGPSLRDSEDTYLKEGHVITVEPGIYIPGWGGVRIEDTILVKDNGYECLTPYTHDLLIV